MRMRWYKAFLKRLIRELESGTYESQMTSIGKGMTDFQSYVEALYDALRIAEYPSCEATPLCIMLFGMDHRSVLEAESHA